MVNKCLVNDCEHLSKGSGLNANKPTRKFIRDVTDNQLREAAKMTKSWRGFLNHLGFATMSGARKRIQNRVKTLGIDVSHFPVQKPRMKCLIKECNELSHSKGYCSRHYGFLKRNGDPLKIIVTGKKRYDTDGYIMLDLKGHPYVTSKAGRIFEHRFVMSQQLGRALHPYEQVHHKNAQRDDNTPENLELWSKNQPIGGRVKDLIVWAKEIIALYGDDETKY